MLRSIRIGPMLLALALISTVWAQGPGLNSEAPQPDKPKPAAPKTGESIPTMPKPAAGQAGERLITVQEANRPAQVCRIVKSWPEGGKMAYQVQAVDTGEMITIVEEGPAN